MERDVESRQAIMVAVPRRRRSSLQAPVEAVNIVLVVLALLAGGPTWAQTPTVLNGAAGATQALDVTASTNLLVPPDGVLQFTSVNIASGAVLTFSKDAENNSPVLLLSEGDVFIAGTIDVSGRDSSGKLPGEGGPGGFDGGNGGEGNLAPSAGHGPGGGPGGVARCCSGDAPQSGSYGTQQNNGSTSSRRPPTYGSPLVFPLLGGSGGGGYVESDGTAGRGGGGGGGAILIASNTQVTLASSGRIDATGGDGRSTCDDNRFNHGSGGGVRIVAPVVSGAGVVDIRGGAYSPCSGSYHGGRGRLRIDASDYSAANFSVPNLVVSTVSRGSYLVARPSNPTTIEIVAVNGAPLPIDGEVVIPFGSTSTTVPVDIALGGFGSDVLVQVAATPNASVTTSTFLYKLSDLGTSSIVTLNVTVLSNVPTRIHAWTCGTGGTTCQGTQQ